jgi:hypothetical protein
MLEACKRRIDQLEHELCAERKRKREEAPGDVPDAGAALRPGKLQANLSAGPHRKKIVNGLKLAIKSLKFRSGYRTDFLMGEDDDDHVMKVKFTEVMSEEEVPTHPEKTLSFPCPFSASAAERAVERTGSRRLPRGGGDAGPADPAEQARLVGHHQDL